MFGFLNVRKPAGPTSHGVVAAVRRRLREAVNTSEGEGRSGGGAARGGRRRPKAGRVKVGHAGTLDPFADGVLVLCVGPATRLADCVQSRPKRYRATIALGATSTTDDPEGEIAPTADAQPLGEAQVRPVLRRFVGAIEQIPPAHSAVHVAGRRAYELARAGRAPQLAARTVRVYGIELLEYAWPRLTINVACGAGTYVRSLARDIGAALGVGGYCAALTRTAVGPFGLETAREPDALELPGDLLDPLTALGHLRRAVVAEADVARVRNGGAIGLDPAAVPAPSDPGAGPVDSAGNELPALRSGADAGAGPGGQEIALLDAAGRLLALAVLDADARTARPSKVFGFAP